MDLTLLHPENNDELELRLSKVRYNMGMTELDAMLVAYPTNLYYLAGGIYRGYVYIPKEGEAIYFLIPPSESDFPQVRLIHKPELIPEILQKEGYDMPKRIGLEFQDLTYSEVERLKNVFTGAIAGDCTMVMRRARMIKTPYEIKLMREDGLRQATVYSQIKHCYQEDMTDLEFQIEIERVLRRTGCLGYLRASGNRMQLNMGSVLSGPNADAPSPYDFSMGGAGIDPSLPVGASGEIMKPGMAVMVDMNGGFNGYQTDMTRCWSIGEVPELAKRAHRCSIDILDDLAKFAKPDIRISEVYARAEKLAAEAGLKDYFMGHRHKVPFIGHGVGIELNEMPVIMRRNTDPLLRDMTIAIEPKFVIPDVGAVGVENTYLVTDDGLENLTVLDETLKEL